LSHRRLRRISAVLAGLVLAGSLVLVAAPPAANAIGGCQGSGQQWCEVLGWNTSCCPPAVQASTNYSTRPSLTQPITWAGIEWVPGGIWQWNVCWNADRCDFSSGDVYDVNPHDFYYLSFQATGPGQIVPGSLMAGYFG
jgi:hypothetical protein